MDIIVFLVTCGVPFYNKILNWYQDQFSILKSACFGVIFFNLVEKAKKPFVVKLTNLYTSECKSSWHCIKYFMMPRYLMVFLSFSLYLDPSVQIFEILSLIYHNSLIWNIEGFRANFKKWKLIQKSKETT